MSFFGKVNVFLTPQTGAATIKPGMFRLRLGELHMAKIRKRSVAPIYAVGAVWLVWSMVLPLYRPAHYIAAGVASLLAYGFGRLLLWRDRVIITPDPEPRTAEAEPAQEAPKAQPEPAAQDPEVAALLAERDRAVGEMRRLNDSIEDPVISAQIDHLEEVTGKIIDHVAHHPQKRPQIRRFLDYYLPTTLKILNAYDRMDSMGVSGTNIDGTKDKIETMMNTLVSAFDKQLDALFGEEALDISTDITVLEQMLAREGLGDTQLHSDT